MFVVPGDFNGDSVRDLVTANESSDDVSILIGNGDGTFAAAQEFEVGRRPRSVAVGDLNGDAVPDLVVANEDSRDVSILLGNGDGTFAAAQDFGAGAEPVFVVAEDLNGDSMQDLVVVNQQGKTNIWILLGNGDGTFGVSQGLAAGGYSQAVAIGDFNGDSVQDLVTASVDISIFFGRGSGLFTGARKFPVGTSPGSMVKGDFNADTVLDLAVTNYGVDTVSVVLGNGDGSVSPPSPALTIAVGSRPVSIAVGYFDGDSAQDLAVANSVSDDISVLLGAGDGTFGTAGRFAVGDGPRSIVGADLNGDSLPDLVVANADSHNISVLLATGNGDFAAAKHFGVGRGPVSVAIGDFNGDSLQDVAVANEHTDDVSILLQVRAPTISSVTPLGAPPGTRVEIHGTGFSVGDVAVFFGGVQAFELEVVDDTTILVTVPLAIRAGPVDVRVSTSSGAVRLGAGLDGFFVTEAQATAVFAVFANGESEGFLNKTRIILRNNDEVATSGILRFKDQTGNPVQVPIEGVADSQIEFSLDPFHTLDLETDGVGALQTGVIEIVQVSGAAPEKLAGTIVFDLLSNFVSVDLTPIRLRHQVYVSVVPGATGEYTGIAAYNPDPQQTATLELVLLNDLAEEQAIIEVLLGPLQQLVGFVDDEEFFRFFFEGSFSPFRGTLNIRVIDGPAVAILGLIQKTEDGALIAVSSSPDAFVASGKPVSVRQQ